MMLPLRRTLVRLDILLSKTAGKIHTYSIRVLQMKNK